MKTKVILIAIVFLLAGLFVFNKITKNVHASSGGSGGTVEITAFSVPATLRKDELGLVQVSAKVTLDPKLKEEVDKGLASVTWTAEWTVKEHDGTDAHYDVVLSPPGGTSTSAWIQVKYEEQSPTTADVTSVKVRMSCYVTFSGKIVGSPWAEETKEETVVWWYEFEYDEYLPLAADDEIEGTSEMLENVEDDIGEISGEIVPDGVDVENKLTFEDWAVTSNGTGAIALEETALKTYVKTTGTTLSDNPKNIGWVVDVYYDGELIDDGTTQPQKIEVFRVSTTDGANNSIGEAERKLFNPSPLVTLSQVEIEATDEEQAIYDIKVDGAIKSYVNSSFAANDVLVNEEPLAEAPQTQQALNQQTPVNLIQVFENTISDVSLKLHLSALGADLSDINPDQIREWKESYFVHATAKNKIGNIGKDSVEIAIRPESPEDLIGIINQIQTLKTQEESWEEKIAEAANPQQETAFQQQLERVQDELMAKMEELDNELTNVRTEQEALASIPSSLENIADYQFKIQLERASGKEDVTVASTDFEDELETFEVSPGLYRTKKLVLLRNPSDSSVVFNAYQVPADLGNRVRAYWEDTLPGVAYLDPLGIYFFTTENDPAPFVKGTTSQSDYAQSSVAEENRVGLRMATKDGATANLQVINPQGSNLEFPGDDVLTYPNTSGTATLASQSSGDLAPDRYLYSFAPGDNPGIIAMTFPFPPGTGNNPDYNEVYTEGNCSLESKDGAGELECIVPIELLEVNLEVDSNNDGEITQEDDAIEEDEEETGLMIGVNDNDDDYSVNPGEDRLDSIPNGYEDKTLDMTEINLQISGFNRNSDCKLKIETHPVWGGKIRIFDRDYNQVFSPNDTEIAINDEIAAALAMGYTFYAEGVESGLIHLTAEVSKNGSIFKDIVKISILEGNAHGSHTYGSIHYRPVNKFKDTNKYIAHNDELDTLNPVFVLFNLSTAVGGVPDLSLYKDENGAFKVFVVDDTDHFPYLPLIDAGTYDLYMIIINWWRELNGLSRINTTFAELLSAYKLTAEEVSKGLYYISINEFGATPGYTTGGKHILTSVNVETGKKLPGQRWELHLAKGNLKALNITKGPYHNNYITAGCNFSLEPIIEKSDNVKAKNTNWDFSLSGTNKYNFTTKKFKALQFVDDNRKSNPEDSIISWKRTKSGEPQQHMHGFYPMGCSVAFEIQLPEGTYEFTDNEWEESNVKEKCFVTDRKYHLLFSLTKKTQTNNEKFSQNYYDTGKIILDKSGKVTVKEDLYGAITRLFKLPQSAWFLHWSSKTYKVCRHGIKNTKKDDGSAETGPWYLCQTSLNFDEGGFYYPPENIEKGRFGLKLAKHPQRDAIYIYEEACFGTEEPKNSPFQGPGGFLPRSSDYRKIPRYSKKMKMPDMNGPELVNKIVTHENAHRNCMMAYWDTKWPSIKTTTSPQNGVELSGYAKDPFGNQILATYQQFPNIAIVEWKRTAQHGAQDGLVSYNGGQGTYIGDRYFIKITITNNPQQPQTIELNDCWIRKYDSNIPITLNPAGISNKTQKFIDMIKAKYYFEEPPHVGRDHRRRVYQDTRSRLAIVNLPKDSDNDGLPDIWEDWHGFTFNNKYSFKGIPFYIRIVANYPADLEFFAEFNSQEVPEPTFENDYANPGYYTGAYEEEEE